MAYSTEWSHLDDHHHDVFLMVQKLDAAIASNTRSAFEPIIEFLEHHCTDHFKEEETLMKSTHYTDISPHKKEHQLFLNKIKSIRKMYNETSHSTHIAYAIRQLIDQLIRHILTADNKMKGATQ